MLNEYKEKLEMQREVLKALPRNNGKNNKLYKEKILELIDLYKKDNSLLYLIFYMKQVQLQYKFLH